jgi:hypothetical protein
MDIFKRSIEVQVDEEEGGHLRLHGTLKDVRLGQDLHGFEVMMLVDVVDGEILEIEGTMPVHPLEECAEGLKSLEELVGVKILPGFSDIVKQTVGSNRGCFHLASLVMNMGNTSVQGRGAFIRKNLKDEYALTDSLKEHGEKLGIVDSCVCWREDGPLVSRWKSQDEPS